MGTPATLSHDAVQKVIRQNLAGVRACFLRVGRDGNQRSGKAIVSFEIGRRRRRSRHQGRRARVPGDVAAGLRAGHGVALGVPEVAEGRPGDQLSVRVRRRLNGRRHAPARVHRCVAAGAVACRRRADRTAGGRASPDAPGPTGTARHPDTGGAGAAAGTTGTAAPTSHRDQADRAEHRRTRRRPADGRRRRRDGIARTEPRSTGSDIYGFLIIAASNVRVTRSIVRGRATTSRTRASSASIRAPTS